MGQPLPDPLGCELRPVIRAEVHRDASLTEQIGKAILDIPMPDVPGHDRRQAFPGVLIDDVHDPKYPAVVCSLLDEIVAPYMVRVQRTKSHT
jgi:hypothetical protein